MSGTSLDGLDLALVQFWSEDVHLRHKLLAGHTYPYSQRWLDAFSELPNTSARLLALADMELGRWMGTMTRKFIDEHCIPQALPTPAYVGSHGHTLFHEPDTGFTTQIGHGAYLAAAAQLPVVADFRTADVALGGQGAPLVPIGDALLYSTYSACLNLGGIANISFRTHAGSTLAFDICAANQVLNLVAAQLGMAYDAGGEVAKRGKLQPHLLAELNTLEYYAQPAPKSMGREWVERYVYPLLDAEAYSPTDVLHTYCLHIAQQVKNTVTLHGITGGILCTGGGSFNTFLVSCINAELARTAWVELPDADTIQYKEAIIFALLALLRVHGYANCLPEVTGASVPVVGGAIHDPLGMLGC